MMREHHCESEVQLHRIRRLTCDYHAPIRQRLPYRHSSTRAAEWGAVEWRDETLLIAIPVTVAHFGTAATSVGTIGFSGGVQAFDQKSTGNGQWHPRASVDHSVLCQP